jgi:pimeloyl-ACP methyl ester carboxylesterase
MKKLFAVLAVVLTATSISGQVPKAITTDPPPDRAHPARMEVLHIPSGGVKINGVAYLASGAGRHPTFVFFHGLPGNEKNLDLAQAVRRAGWNAITVNYRGSWGSPGEFRFAGNLEDADAVLSFVHDTANARQLGIDTRRIVIAGHSMGGWVTVHTASHHPELLGAILISAADMGATGLRPRDSVIEHMAGDMESLSGATPESMADEVRANSDRFRFARAAQGLAHTPLLVITSDDSYGPRADSLVKQVRALGNSRITVVHLATDHSYSDKRIALETAVINWLAKR